jgi:choline dehydrogenase-like flavoprotein
LGFPRGLRRIENAMTFSASTYGGFVAEDPAARRNLFPTYARDETTPFDVAIVGSGMGGGILADALADRFGDTRRILLLEAGPLTYPTHVYNLCRFPNASVAARFQSQTFWQESGGNTAAEHFLGLFPQLNLGGRSIFWSGLIPTIQAWELAFFPPRVRQALETGLLNEAGDLMNESASMGATAATIVRELQKSALDFDFSIQQTPRALHQPYLEPDGKPKSEFFAEPTGVFNTAELIINQLGEPKADRNHAGPGLHLLLNSFVEDVQRHHDRHELVVRDTLTGAARTIAARQVVLAGGSIESPKLLRRSSLYPWLPDHVKGLLGRGLTDHPTTDEITTFVTHIAGVPIPKTAHAKIILYSRGRPESDGGIRYPFNVEMNVNHEYWHLRENDPGDPRSTFSTVDPNGPSRVDIKFSFANLLDEENEIRPAPPFGYVPEIVFGNLNWMDRLAGSRFPALAGWKKTHAEIFATLNGVTHAIFSQFRIDGQPARPARDDDGAEVWYGQRGKDFGWGTVNHAAGSLRMPFKPSRDADFDFASVVDEDLQVIGAPNLYVCDMSVMPISSSANPVRTLAALALRLARHLP